MSDIQFSKLNAQEYADNLCQVSESEMSTPILYSLCAVNDDETAFNKRLYKALSEYDRLLQELLGLPIDKVKLFLTLTTNYVFTITELPEFSALDMIQNIHESNVVTLTHTCVTVCDRLANILQNFLAY